MKEKLYTSISSQYVPRSTSRRRTAIAPLHIMSSGFMGASRLRLWMVGYVIVSLTGK